MLDRRNKVGIRAKWLGAHRKGIKGDLIPAQYYKENRNLKLSGIL